MTNRPHALEGSKALIFCPEAVEKFIVGATRFHAVEKVGRSIQQHRIFHVVHQAITAKRRTRNDRKFFREIFIPPLVPRGGRPHLT
jgi:hypothetical protein